MSQFNQELYLKDQPSLSGHPGRASDSDFFDHRAAKLLAINPSISSWRPRQSNYSDMSLRNPDFSLGLIASLLFHLIIGFFLMYDASSPRAVLVNEAQNEPGQISSGASATPSEPEIIKAVSVNSDEVKDVVNRLKQERAQQAQAEKIRQQQLARQAESARQQRIMEEKRLSQLKDESEKIAIARKKQLEEEQQHLKQLAVQKEQEKKRLQEMKHEQEVLKKQQQEEAVKLAALKQKQAMEQARVAKEKIEKEKAALAAAENLKRQEAAARQAQLDAANQARNAGVVDKYKALIIDAISRQWILPDNVDHTLSSQFRIRLAPDGAVLDVSLIRSSGDLILDRSAQTAIYKASPLPVPGDPTTFNMFRDISLTVRPENIRG